MNFVRWPVAKTSASRRGPGFFNKIGLYQPRLPFSSRPQQRISDTRKNPLAPESVEGRVQADVEILPSHRWRCGADQTGRMPALLAAAMLFLVDADLGALSVILAPVFAGDERVGRGALVDLYFRLGGHRSRIRGDVRGRFRGNGRAGSEP